MDVYEVNFTAYEYYDTGGNSNISTMCDFNNSTIFQNEDENTEISTGFKIFGLIMYLIGCLGIFSGFGIIHYEKYGQDSQKRSFSDQILSFNGKIVMIVMPISWGISQIRWIFGPVGYNVAVFQYYLGSSLLLIPFGITESILFQCLMVFSWKKCAMINDEFFTMFFNITNLVVAQIISVIRLMTDQLYMKDQFEIYSGVKVHEQEKQ